MKKISTLEDLTYEQREKMKNAAFLFTKPQFISLYSSKFDSNILGEAYSELCEEAITKGIDSKFRKRTFSEAKEQVSPTKPTPSKKVVQPSKKVESVSEDFKVDRSKVEEILQSSLTKREKVTQLFHAGVGRKEQVLLGVASDGYVYDVFKLNNFS